MSVALSVGVCWSACVSTVEAYMYLCGYMVVARNVMSDYANECVL